MIWYEVIFKYWAQITVMMGVIGAVFKIWLDFKNQRTQAKYNLFYKERMDYTIQFYSKYFDTKTVLTDYISKSSYTELTYKELDENVTKKVRELKLLFYYIELLYPKLITESFKKIQYNLERADGGLKDLFLFQSNDPEQRKRNEKDSIKIITNYIDINDKILSEIGELVRSEFQI